MATTYTRNFRLNKPDFRTSPWSDQVNENTDRLDSIVFNAQQASNIAPFTNDEDVEAGEIRYDVSNDNFWLCRESHTTIAVGDFPAERIAFPFAWTPVQFGLNPRGQWTQNTYYNYYDLAFDAPEKVSGLCLIPHLSPNSGTMRGDAANWVFLIDVQGDVIYTASAISYSDIDVPFTAANVQEAIDATNVRIDNAATVVSGINTTVNGLSTTVSGHTTTIGNHTTDLTNLKAIDTLVKTANGTLSAERVVTDDYIVWDWATAGVVKASLASGSFASQAQAEAGSENTKVMTALRVKQSIAVNVNFTGYATTSYVNGTFIAASTAYGTFVTAVRGVYAGDIGVPGDSATIAEISNAWLTGQSELMTSRFRYVQYAINGGWYTAGWAS